MVVWFASIPPAGFGVTLGLLRLRAHVLPHGLCPSATGPMSRAVRSTSALRDPYPALHPYKDNRKAAGLLTRRSEYSAWYLWRVAPRGFVSAHD